MTKTLNDYQAEEAKRFPHELSNGIPIPKDMQKVVQAIVDKLDGLDNKQGTTDGVIHRDAVIADLDKLSAGPHGKPSVSSLSMRGALERILPEEFSVNVRALSNFAQTQMRRADANHDSVLTADELSNLKLGSTSPDQLLGSSLYPVVPKAKQSAPHK